MLLGLVLGGCGPRSDAALRDIAFEVDEGTWMSVDVSPDGSTLVFDLIGHVYALPIEGGTARPLTSGASWNRAPRYSPDGTELALVRDENGPDEVWLMPASGGTPRQLTDHSPNRSGWVSGTPSWSPDGQSIFIGEYDRDFEENLPIHRVELATGRVDTLERDYRGSIRHSGVLAPDGRSFFFGEHPEAIDPRVLTEIVLKYPDDPSKWPDRSRPTGVVRLDLATGARERLTDGPHYEYTPRLSRDGRRLAYLRRDKQGRTALRMRELTAEGQPVPGTDRELVALPAEDDPFRFDTSDERPAYAFTPDGEAIVIGTGGKLHRVDVATGADAIIPFRAEVRRTVPPLARARTSLPDGPVVITGIQWPRLTPDGSTLVFGAVGYLWVQSLPDGTPRRLTAADADHFEFTPALSPDGRTVAYIEMARSGFATTPGRLMTVPLAGGEPTVVLSGPATYLAPSWSPDGGALAFIQDRADSSFFGWVSLANAVPQLVAPVQRAQRETWGRLIFFSNDGRSLRYSWEYDPAGGRPDSTEMREVPLAGGPSRLVAMGGRDTRGMVPSPDGRFALVMGIDDDLRVLPLPGDGSVARTNLEMPRLTETGAEFVDWRNDSTFIYGFANRIYQARVGGGRPELIHTVELQFPRRTGEGVTALTNARIITVNGDHGAGQVIERGTLVVEGRRIAAVGPSESVAVPPGARVIDATGLTLVPAIGDMHYHSQGGTNLFSKMVFDGVLDGGELGLRQSVAYGVTTGWQPGGPTRNGGGLALAELRETGRIEGPRWINAPWGVNMSTYADNAPSVFATPDDAVRITRHRAAQGATVLKEYMTRRRDHRRWLGDAARTEGVAIVSHVEGLDQALSRAADGYTGFDHPAFAVPVYEDVRQFLALTGTIWTANTNVARSNATENDQPRRAFVREVLRRWPEQRDKWQYHYPNRRLDSLPPVLAMAETRMGRIAKAAAYLMAGGVKIGISAHNPPPLYTLAEMWYLQEAGAPPADVLRAGTMVGAEKLGLERELGSLEVGKVADLLVLTANPLDDVMNLVAQKYVMTDGVLHDVAVPPRPIARAATPRHGRTGTPAP